MVECFMCGLEFQPTALQLQLFAETGCDFEPTDWTCPECDTSNSRNEECENSFALQDEVLEER